MARKAATPARLFTVPEPPGPVRRVRRGVDATVAALRAGGRLEPVDAGLVALVRTLADAVDDEHTAADGSRFTVASLAGKLLPALDRLRGVDVGPDHDDLTAALFGALPDRPEP
jgi:hypothetical protein